MMKKLLMIILGSILFVHTNISIVQSSDLKSFAKIIDIKTLHQGNDPSNNPDGIEVETFTGDIPKNLNLEILLKTSLDNKKAIFKVKMLPLIGTIFEKTNERPDWSNISVFNKDKTFTLNKGNQKILIRNIPLRSLYYNEKLPEHIWYFKMKIAVELLIDSRSVYKMSIIRNSNMAE